MDYIRWIDGRKRNTRLLLALPILDGITYGAYRIAHGGKNVLLGIVWIPFGACIGWFLDMMSILTGKKVFTIKRY